MALLNEKVSPLEQPKQEVCKAALRSRSIEQAECLGFVTSLNYVSARSET